MYRPTVLSLLLGVASAKYGHYANEYPASTPPAVPQYTHHYDNSTSETPYTSSADVYSTPSQVTYGGPTNTPHTCESEGTYTFPATTYTATETVTICGASHSYLTKGKNVYGGYTTTVYAATTVTVPYASVETYDSETSTAVYETVYTCPVKGAYTIAATTTYLAHETEYWYPVPTVYAPGTYVQPETTVTATAGEVVYRPYETSSPSEHDSESETSVYAGEFVIGLGVSGSAVHKQHGFSTYIGFTGSKAVVVGTYEEAAVFYFEGEYLKCGSYYIGISTGSGYTAFEQYESAPTYTEIYIVNGAIVFYSSDFTLNGEGYAEICGNAEGYLYVETSEKTPFYCSSVYFYGVGHGGNTGTCGTWSSPGPYSAPSSEESYSSTLAVYSSTFATEYYSTTAEEVYSTPAAEVYSTSAEEVYSTSAEEVYSTSVEEVYSTPAAEVYSTSAEEVYSTPAPEAYSTPSEEVYSTPAAEVYSTPAAEVYSTPAPYNPRGLSYRARRV